MSNIAIDDIFEEMMTISPSKEEQKPKVIMITSCVKVEPKPEFETLVSTYAIPMLEEIQHTPLNLSKTKTKSQVQLDTKHKICGHRIFLSFRVLNYVNKLGTKRSEFQNSLTFKYDTQTNGKRSIKVFKKGTVHATGFRSEEEIRTVVPQFLEELLQTKFQHQNTMIYNINAMFDLGHKIYNFEHAIMANMQDWEKMKWRVFWEPEITMAHMSIATDTCIYLIYKSGKVTVTGVKKEDELLKEKKKLMSAFIFP